MVTKLINQRRKKQNSKQSLKLNQKRLAACVYSFILDTFTAIKNTNKILSITHYDEYGRDFILPEFEDVEIACSTDSKIELSIAFETITHRVYTIPYAIYWGDYILNEAFPNKPRNADTKAYSQICTYAFPIHDEKADHNILLFDASPHHDYLSTHPHHLHTYSNLGNKNEVADPYTGLLRDFTSELNSKIK